MKRWKVTLESMAHVSCDVIIEAETEQEARDAAIDGRPAGGWNSEDWEVDSLREPIDVEVSEVSLYVR